MTMELPLPPGSLGLPLLGETLPFGANPGSFVEKRWQQFGPIFRTHLLGAPVVVMAGAEALRFVLLSHRDHFSSRQGWPRALQELMRGALLMVDGEDHAEVRRLLAPAFFGRSLEGYLPTMAESARRYLERWTSLGRFRWYDELKRFSFDVASQLILGARPGVDLERLGRLFDTYCRGMVGLNPVLTFGGRWTPYGRAVAARDDLLAHVGSLVEERRQLPANDALGRMVQAIDDAGGGGGRAKMSQLDVARHALFLLFAGHESSAALMTCFCYQLASHPEILARARQEQESLGIQDPLTVQRIGEMAFLERIFLELERLHPPFPGAFRSVVEPFEFHGCRVPAGHKLFYSITATHHDAETYPEPKRFAPDRFASLDVAELRRDCRLVGFGAGPRTCLGMDFARLEMKLLASALLRHYEWELEPGRWSGFNHVPSMHPKDGLQVRFRRRTPASQP